MADDARYLAALKKELVYAPDRAAYIEAEITRVSVPVTANAAAKADRAKPKPKPVVGEQGPEPIVGNASVTVTPAAPVTPKDA